MIRKGKRAYYRNERDTPEWWAVRREVLKRDGYRCQMPGCKKRSRLQVHHVIRWADSVHTRYTASSLITLCKTCHDSIKDIEHHYKLMFLRIAAENEEKSRKK